MEKCKNGCHYSSGQDRWLYDRECLKCGHPESSSNQEKIGSMRMKEFDIRDMAQLISVIHHRNEIIKAGRESLTFEWESWEDIIMQINKDIKKILQLT